MTNPADNLDEPIPVHPMMPLGLFLAHFAARILDGQTPMVQIDGEVGGKQVSFEVRVSMKQMEVH